MKVTTVQIRQRGVITLPAKLRQRHNLEPGDTLTLIDLDGTFFVTPKVSLVPTLATEIERLRQEAGLSTEDLLEGLGEQRRRYYREKRCTSA
jgi:AbrB family looped-hinge helix DNA binding protein